MNQSSNEAIEDPKSFQIYQLSLAIWISLSVCVVALIASFYDSLKYMYAQWGTAEYNYAYLIPFIVAYLIWQKRSDLQVMAFTGSWIGVLLIIFGFLLFVVGQLAAVFSVMQYAFVVAIMGLGLSLTGIQSFRHVCIPLLILFFMVPLPGFLHQTLSNDLQLLSSKIGVQFIRLFGISVFLEGNVIDIGTMKLQVVEACNGLRYLFPLLTLGFIIAYMFKTAIWKRAVVFLSTIPITVLMNSFRIGVIGLLVEYWGKDQAEGFLHDFEGWAIFMACLSILLLEMWLLTAFGKKKILWKDMFGHEESPSLKASNSTRPQPLTTPFLVSIGLVLAMATASASIPKPKELIPPRIAFSEFPMSIGGWIGTKERMEQIYIDALNFDDYIMANFTDTGHRPVNLYIGYYETQHADRVPHSPRACLPGGGWVITSFDRRTIDGLHEQAKAININRAVIENRGTTHLVYYWFKQRDRIIVDEYKVKLLILWDSLTRSRTDGALIRITTAIGSGENIDRADERLLSFARRINPLLSSFVPD